MPVINVNLIPVANQAFDSLPVEVKPADQPAETVPASTASNNTNVAGQGYGRGIAKTYSGAVR